MTQRYLGPYTYSHYFFTVSPQEPQEYDEAHRDHSPTRFFGSPFVCVNGKPTASLSYPFIPQKIISSMWGFKSNLKVSGSQFKIDSIFGCPLPLPQSRCQLWMAPRLCKEHCYRKKAASVGQNGRHSASCNFFSF